MNGRGRRGRRDDLPVRAEVNVTSLIDIAFTLLVIFIITAPMLQGGIEVKVPEADVPPLTSREDPIIVSIDERGRVFLGQTEVAPEEVATSLPQLLRAANARMVYIKGDSVAHYGRVLDVIATVAQVEGITYGLVAEPRPRRTGRR